MRARSSAILLFLCCFSLFLSAAEFRTSGSYRVGLGPVAVAAADFDGDGKLDLAVVNSASNTVSVLLGNGDGTFRRARALRVGMDPQALAIGDLNGDRIPDLVVANAGGGDVSVLLGRGDGSFGRARSYRAGLAPQSVAVADLNHDGNLDVVAASSGSATVSVLRGRGDGSFRHAVDYRVGAVPQSLVAGDFNGDGFADVAVTNPGSHNLSLLLNAGDGALQPARRFQAGKNPEFLVAGDFDGDGNLDLAVIAQAGIMVLAGKGDGSFRKLTNYAVATQVSGLVAADFEGSKTLSLAVMNPTQNSVTLLSGAGTGSLIPAADFRLGTKPAALASGDFNGDGAPDLAVANSDDTVTVLLNMPVVDFSPHRLKFGTRAVGTHSPGMTVTLRNRGGAPLNISDIRLAGKQARDFAETGCPLGAHALAPQQSCTFQITFSPTALGTRKARLLIIDNAWGSPHSVALSGGDPAANTVWLGGAGNWSDPSKWSNGVPTSSVDALIDNGNGQKSPVTLDTGGQVNNLTMDSDDSLSFNNGTSLNINGSNIGNAGTISLQSAGSLTTLFVVSGATLAGTGAVTMGNNSQNQVNGNSGTILTNQSTIQGAGMIGPHFTLANQGTVNANVSGGILVLGPGSGATYSNTATMEATNGGILQLNLVGINNTGGTIEAVGANSQVQLTGGGDNLTGGTLTTSGGGTMTQTAGSSTLTNLTNSGTFSLSNGTSVSLSGTITNTGAFQLKSSGSLTTLFVPTAATLTGAGKVNLANNSQNQVDGNGGATLTNASTIQGVGLIGPHFTLANQGTVNANVSGGILVLGPGSGATYSNTATMEATNGGILQLNLVGINNTGGTIEAVGANSQVQLTGGGDNLTGGTLTTSGGGTMTQTAGSSTLTNLTNSGTFSLSNGTSVSLSGTITNTGAFQLKSSGSLTTLFVPTAATLTGAGKVNLANNSQNQVDGNGGATLTNASTIQGVGLIGPHFTLANQGTINANVSGAVLALGAGNAPGYTNTATLEATNGGILQINTGSGSINNAGGTILADGANSQVQFPGNGNNITGGTLSGSNGGTIVQNAGSSTLTNVTNAGAFQVQNGGLLNLSGTLTNNGTVQINSTGSLTGFNLPAGSATLAGAGTVVLNNNPASIIDGNGGLTFTNQSTIKGGGTIGPHVTFSNKGGLRVPVGNTLNINAPFSNFSGTTLTGGIYVISGTLQFTGANIVKNAAHITLNGANSRIIDQNGGDGLANLASLGGNGSLTLQGGRSFATSRSIKNSGTVTIAAGSKLIVRGAGNYTQLQGTTLVDGTLKAHGLINLQTGDLLGNGGTLAGNFQSSGAVVPGDSVTQTGLLAVSGTYTQTSTGSLNIGIAGVTPGTQYGQLNVVGAVTLDGTLNLTLLNGFIPSVGQTFTVLTGASVAGTFPTVNGVCINSSEHFGVTYNPANVTLTVLSGACQ